MHKVQKIRDMSFNYHGLYFDLQLGRVQRQMQYYKK